MDNFQSQTYPQDYQPIEETVIRPKKPNFFKRRKKLIIFSIIALVVIIFIIIGIVSSKGKIEYTTIIAERQDLKQSVDATGKIESAETIALNFRTSGRIQKIYVKAGDQVKTGQRLAELDMSALQSQVDDARAKLNQAQANYNELLAGASAQEILVKERTVEQKLQALTTEENDLDNLKQYRDIELENLKESAVTVLNNEISVAQGALDEVNNTLNDSDAQSTLSIENSAYLDSAELNQDLAKILLDANKNEINMISILDSNQEIFTALDNLKITLDKIAETLSNTLNVLGATITSSTLTETELDALKTNIKNYQTKINTSKTSVNSAKSNWNEKTIYYQQQITAAEDSVSSAQKALETASAELNLTKSPPRPFEIDVQQAIVSQYQANLNLAYARLNEGIITAPVDGTITKKNLEVGEYAALTSPVLEMIGESNLQTEVDIPESDIAKIKLGQDVAITLDAFTADDIFTGKVVFMDPAETIISEVVYYKVKVQFDKLIEEIKPGMTANVTICTDKKENVIAVPARAVKSENGDKYVDILITKNGKQETVKRKVTTGLRGDEGIEIISGLQVGEEVVTFIKE